MSPGPPSFCRLSVRVIPNAPRNEIAGWLGEALKVKIHAPPLEGRANDELCIFIADVVGTSRRNVRVSQGEKSRQKVLAIEGLSLEEVKRRVS